VSAPAVDLVVAERKKELERHRFIVDGATATAADADGTDAAVVFTLTPADAEAVKAGTIDLSVAFMRGTTKMAGDYGVLLHVLPVLSRSRVL
jgi:acyl-coenzyme A thioesterase PaaI-like protein